MRAEHRLNYDRSNRAAIGRISRRTDMTRLRPTAWVLLAGLGIGYAVPGGAAASGQKKDASVKRESSDKKRTSGAVSFGDDVEFLKKHTAVLVLERGDARVAVCP